MFNYFSIFSQSIFLPSHSSLLLSHTLSFLSISFTVYLFLFIDCTFSFHFHSAYARTSSISLLLFLPPSLFFSFPITLFLVLSLSFSLCRDNGNSDLIGVFQQMMPNLEFPKERKFCHAEVWYKVRRTESISFY